MAKKKQKFVLYEGELLNPSDDKAMLQRKNLLGTTRKRRARYWCYRYRTEATGGTAASGAPPGFKDYIESLGGFSGWDLFADKWDITGENPFMIVYRLMSVWEEWDHVMRRVAIPIDSTPMEIAARMKILEQEYKG